MSRLSSIRFALVCAGALCVVGPLSATRAAPRVTLKLATIAPEGSPWHDILLEMAERWRIVSNGAVSVKIYGGGVQGDESESVRKIRIGLLHGATVTANGLATITPAMNAFSIPLLFSSYDELDFARDRLSARLTKAFDERGFVVLNWGDGGWVRFFTTKPASTIHEVRALRIFTWAGNSDSEELWKQAGFRPVPLAPTDILTSLQSGLIDGCPVPATAALAYQWFGLADHMLDLRIAPIVGATVIAKAAWGNVDPALRPVLLKEAQTIGARLRRDIRQLDDEAIAAMRKRGLQVTTPTAQGEKEWRDAAAAIYPRIRGSIISGADFDGVVSLVREHRASKPSTEIRQ
jgi:TRAP-type transport system periplasmic protein